MDDGIGADMIFGIMKSCSPNVLERRFAGDAKLLKSAEYEIVVDEQGNDDAHAYCDNG